MMECLNPSSKTIIFLSLMSAILSCDNSMAAATLSTTTKNQPVQTQTFRSNPIPTDTPIPIPTVFGTPLSEYQTIPIPMDAVAGMQVGNQYQFTSKQPPDNIVSYYQGILPQIGWKIQDISTVEFNDKNTTNICMTLSQINSPLQAIVCASKRLSDELTYVRITVFITD